MKVRAAVCGEVGCTFNYIRGLATMYISSVIRQRNLNESDGSAKRLSSKMSARPTQIRGALRVAMVGLRGSSWSE